jgi:hypothetical protein
MKCTNLRKQIINRDHLKGANKIDELWPPNPNEFDSATFTSHFSFCGPTSMLTSYVNMEIVLDIYMKDE